MGLYGDLGREQDRRFAKAERPEGTQGMSKPKVCESAFEHFEGFVFDLSANTVFDFLGFWIFWALSHRAVRGLYRSMLYV